MEELKVEKEKKISNSNEGINLHYGMYIENWISRYIGIALGGLTTI